MRVRLVPLPLAALAAAFALASCGGGGAGTDPAAVAPPRAPVFIDVTLRPDTETGEAIDSLAEAIAGVDDLGGLIVSELEDDADEPVDFATEVEPWLGERAGLFLDSYDGDDFQGYGIAIQTTDAGAAREFVEDHAEEDGTPAKDASYADIEFKVEADGTAVGVVDDLVLLAEDQATFEEAVDASGGDSLADSSQYSGAIEAAPADSFADLYVDLGGLIEQSGDVVDPEVEGVLEGAGIEPGEATAVASLIPGEDRIEVDLSTDATGENPTEGDASALLEAMPGGAVVAFSTAEFGDRLGELVDTLDANGLGSDIQPGELKAGLAQVGVDLEAIADSVGDAAAFLESGPEGPGGALVMETTGPEAKDSIAGLGGLLGSAGVDGVSAVGNGLSGFSVRDPDLGDQPLVIAAKGDRVAIAYGMAAATKALTAAGPTLGEAAGFKAAAEALGDTPPAAFVEGPALLEMIESLVGPGDPELEAIAAFLEPVEYLVVGSGAEGERSTAKLIVGVGR
ncbi:MAG: DUF3352 domain-containing protein [Solirubrobacterales bacterium]